MSDQLPPPIPSQKVTSSPDGTQTLPYYKQKWFIPVAIIVAVITFNSCGSDSESASPIPSATPEVSQPTPSPTPEPTLETLSPSPSPSEDIPESPIMFAAGVSGDLLDMEKDLDDLLNAVAEGGVLRVAINVAELAANYGQLSSHTPPVEIAEDWNAAMASLDAEIDVLAELVNQDGSIKELKSQVEVISNQIDEMQSIVAQIE